MADPHGPIGVFDSGVGGLTVLRTLRRRLPGERLLYVGDTARVPYGTKSPEAVLRYSREIVAFLETRRVKLVVIACNTASALALPHLVRDGRIPVIGVIEPGARAAAQASRSGRIGVLGTPATIRSGAYARAIRRHRPAARVYSQACPLFVPLVEEGWRNGSVVESVARRYLAPLRRARVDTVILGCTHYPALRGVIQKVMGSGVTLIDSAEAVADVVRSGIWATGHARQKRALRRARLGRSSRAEGPYAHTPLASAVEFRVTDDPKGFVRVGRRLFGNGLAAKHVRRLAL